VELEEVRKATRQFDLVFVPIEEKKNRKPLGFLPKSSFVMGA